MYDPATNDSDLDTQDRSWNDMMYTRITGFELGGHRYDISLTDTRGFFRVPSIVPLPKAPPIIEGIINVRGAAIPVLAVQATSLPISANLSNYMPCTGIRVPVQT